MLSMQKQPKICYIMVNQSIQEQRPQQNENQDNRQDTNEYLIMAGKAFRGSAWGTFLGALVQSLVSGQYENLKAGLIGGAVIGASAELVAHKCSKEYKNWRSRVRAEQSNQQSNDNVPCEDLESGIQLTR